ncbi:hypothetical protein AMTRI_Chr06g196470 [Amborella trichopoda]
MFCPLALLSYSTDTSSCRICRHLGPSPLSTCTDDSLFLVHICHLSFPLLSSSDNGCQLSSSADNGIYLLCPLLIMFASCKAKGIPFDLYKKEALPSFKAGPHSSSLLKLNSSPLLSGPLPEAFTNLSTFT